MGPVTQTMALAIPVDPAVLGVEKGASGPGVDTSGSDFLQVLAEEEALSDQPDPGAVNWPIVVLAALDPSLPYQPDCPADQSDPDNPTSQISAYQSIMAARPADPTLSAFTASVQSIAQSAVPDTSQILPENVPAGVTVPVAKTPAVDQATSSAASMQSPSMGLGNFMRAAANPVAKIAASLEQSAPHPQANGTALKDAKPARPVDIAASDVQVTPDPSVPLAKPFEASSIAIEQRSAALFQTPHLPAVDLIQTLSLPDQHSGIEPTGTTTQNSNDNTSQTATAATQNSTLHSSKEAAWRQKWASDDQVEGIKPANVIEPNSTTSAGHVLDVANPKPALSQFSPPTNDSVGDISHSAKRATDTHMHSSQSPVPSAATPATAATSEILTFDAVPVAQNLGERHFGQLETSAAFGTPLLSSVASTFATTAVSATNLTPAIIEMTRTGNDGPVELALAPEELGRLTISIRHEGDFLHVTLAAERPETLDLLRRHAGDLLADLRQSGFSGASFSFGDGGQGHATAFANTAGTEKDTTGPQLPIADTILPTSSLTKKGAGLDIRL